MICKRFCPLCLHGRSVLNKISSLWKFQGQQHSDNESPAFSVELFPQLCHLLSRRRLSVSTYVSISLSCTCVFFFFCTQRWYEAHSFFICVALNSTSLILPLACSTLSGSVCVCVCVCVCACVCTCVWVCVSCMRVPMDHRERSNRTVGVTPLIQRGVEEKAASSSTARWRTARKSFFHDVLTYLSVGRLGNSRRKSHKYWAYLAAAVMQFYFDICSYIIFRELHLSLDLVYFVKTKQKKESYYTSPA